MSRKLSIVELRQIAKKRGGKCLSETYINNHTPLLWECGVGHKWKATAKNIRRGAWCHICGGSANLTIEEMKKIAKERGGKCLSKSYINNRSKLVWECREGHVWKAVPNSIRNGTWCPECGIKKRSESQKLDIKDMIDLAERRSGKCLSNSYVNAHTKLLWECAEGHQWEATPNDIQQGTWCPFCSGTIVLTIDDMQKIAQERRGKCLSDTYVNAHTKLLWECAEGHQWEATSGTVKRGSWCPMCAGNIALTIDDMHVIAEERGGKCLSENYLNTDTKILWECAEGHQWKASPDRIKSGRWCPICSSGLGERICREFFEQLFGKQFPKAYPKWLINKSGNQMELDGFCESLGIAFEHQGEQHYSTETQFIKTEQGLKKRQEDDRLKVELCEQHGIVLIAIPEINGRLPISEVKRYIKTECVRYSFPLPINLDTIKVDLKKAYATSWSREALNELRAIAEERGGKCLSSLYADNNTPLVWECQKGHHWEATPVNIKIHGSWCPTCAGRPILTIKDMKVLADKRGGKCLSDTYVNNRTKLLWECVEGHQWEAIPATVKRGRWCPICARFRSGATQRLGIDEMREIARNRGGKCLSDKYINNKTKLLWQCKEGHRWLAAPSKIKSGQWCPTCAGRPILTIKDMKELADMRGGKCLSDTYVNNRTKLLWECRKGHRWEAVPSSVKSGTWCPICRKTTK